MPYCCDIILFSIQKGEFIYAEHEKEITETKIKFMQHEYIIAARQSLPKQPVVELARVTISAKGASIRDAKDPYQPKADELDLR